ncbi:hypothetical protein LJC61_05245 [Ruminococcaceae bacterium OttesenSCG-928-A16]|nr:hypothetical protein [Ruminococcaceae bacterium OttesenSCG-928-A16]
MGSSLLLSPSERPEWKIDSEVFERALRNNYPEISIKRRDNPQRYFEWTIEEDGKNLEGWLFRSLDCISFDTSDGAIGADFAIFCRGFMPEEAEIILYDESYSSVLPITIRTSLQDIQDVFWPNQ